MYHFLLHPDYSKLSKYVLFPESVEVMNSQYHNGFEMVVECYYEDNELKFAGGHIEIIEEGFKQLLEKYRIVEHYDNLLFLALSKRVEIDNVKFHYEDTYAFKKRSKELAQLLIAFKESGERHFNSLMLKTLTSTTKITEPELMTWIVSLIQDSINQGKVPYSVLGLEDMQMYSDEELRIKAEQRIVKPVLGYNRYFADFCFTLYPYLVNETSLRPNPGTIISDDQANFFFQLLVLLEMLIPEAIESEPQDYMRTVLKNQINRLNPR